MFKKIILNIFWVVLLCSTQANAVQIEILSYTTEVSEGSSTSISINYTQEKGDIRYVNERPIGCSINLHLLYSGDAIFDEDYSILSEKNITFTANPHSNQNSQTINSSFTTSASVTNVISYKVTSDDGFENDEVFSITIEEESGNCIINPSSKLTTHEVTIKDTEPKEELTAAFTDTQIIVDEGAGVIEVAKVGFSPKDILGEKCSATAQVSVTSAGSGIKGKDFIFNDNQLLSFGGSLKDPQAITLNILNNTENTDNTTVELKATYNIENSVMCQLVGDAPVEITKTITIKNKAMTDKVTATFNQEQSSVKEGAGTLKIGSINFSGDSNNTQNANCSVSAKINILGGTASQGTDYELLSSADIVFNGSDNNLVTPIKINVKEGVAGGPNKDIKFEAFFKLLPSSAATCELTSAPSQQFTVTITDDPYDTSNIELQSLSNDSVAQEGDTIDIKIALKNNSTLSSRALGACEMSADWKTHTTGSAIENEDYTFNPPSVISFNGSDPIKIPLKVLKDTISEEKETLNIKVALKGTGTGPCSTIPERVVSLAALTLVDANLRSKSCARLDNKKEAGTITSRELSFHTSNCKNTNEVIRNFEAEEVATQTDAVLGGAERQLRNVRSRLDKLRSTNGQRGVDISGSNISIQGASLPVGLLGGSAGDDDESELLAGSRWGIFVNGEYAFGEKDHGSERAPGSGDRNFDFNSKGLTIGADYRFPGEKFIAGGAIGYKDFNSDYTTQDGFTNTKGANLSLYGTYLLSDKSYLDAIVGFGKDQIDSRRPINNDGSGGDIATFAIGKPDANEYTFSVGGGYDIRSNEWTFTPYGRLDYTKGTIDAYNETASHSSASTSLFRINRQDVESLTSALGVKASRVYSSSKGVFIPHASFEWKHELKDRGTISGKSLFLNEEFEVDNRTEIDKDYYNISVGVSAVFPKGRSAYLNLESRLGDSDIKDNAIKAGFRWEF